MIKNALMMGILLVSVIGLMGCITNDSTPSESPLDDSAPEQKSWAEQEKELEEQFIAEKEAEIEKEKQEETIQQQAIEATNIVIEVSNDGYLNEAQAYVDQFTAEHEKLESALATVETTKEYKAHLETKTDYFKTLIDVVQEKIDNGGYPNLMTGELLDEKMQVSKFKSSLDNLNSDLKTLQQSFNNAGKMK